MTRLMPHRVQDRQRFWRNFWRDLLGGVAILPGLTCGALATEDAVGSPGNFGGTGLLEMPTARFAPDGELTLGLHYQDQATRVFATWQATPWLEANLSYTDTARGPVDRALDLKIRLWQEADYRPALAVGLRDMLGSGGYGGEYITASKRYYDFDFTVGIGWGLLAGRNGVYNVFRVLGDDFDARDSLDAEGGKIRPGNYFAGRDMAFFGGVEYQIPLKGLTAKLEYSSIDTSRLAEFAHLEDRSAFNAGLNYKPVSWMNLALGYEHGDRLTFRLTLSANLHRVTPAGWARGREPLPVRPRRRPESGPESGPEKLADAPGAGPENALPEQEKRLFNRLSGLGYHVVAVSAQEHRIILTLRQAGQGGGSGNLAALGAVLESYDQAELHFENEEGGEERLAARREDNIGRMAREKFRRSAVYLREQAATGLSRPEGLRTLAETALSRLEDEGLKPYLLELDGPVATLRHGTGPYPQIPKNSGRAARVLSRDLPDHVDAFRIIPEREGLALADITVLRKEFEKAHDYQGSPEEILSTAVIRAPQNPPGQAMEDGDENAIRVSRAPDRATWDIYPELVTHFGGNDSGKFHADLYVTARGEIRAGKGAMLSGELRQRLVGDLDRIPGQDSSTAPAVRSDIGRYAAEGGTALKRLQAAYVRALRPEVYGRVSAGYLDSMFAGLDTELLYKAYDKNWALGANIHWVKQRDFDQFFSLREYDTVGGHVNFYHENVRYNISTVLRAGRYLAGDWGGTLDISRRFDNGMRIGVWATVTDMSSRDFGEGSFDKGIYMKIPFGLFWPRPENRTEHRDLPLTFQDQARNGGQRLRKDVELYDFLSEGNKNRLRQDWRHILD